MTNWQKIKYFLLAAGSFMLYLLYKSNESLRAKLGLEKFRSKDSASKEKQTALDQRIKEKKDYLASLKPPKDEDLDKDAVEDYWRKK